MRSLLSGRSIGEVAQLPDRGGEGLLANYGVGGCPATLSLRLVALVAAMRTTLPLPPCRLHEAPA
jgi:hypothetical protein